MRTHYCTDLNETNIGQDVVLTGWANNYRDHGGIVFIDLRDKTGLIQLTCDPEDGPQAHKVADGVRDEYVLIAKGTVRLRGEGLTNPRLKTGAIEIIVNELIIENKSAPVPFVIGDKNVGEETTLKYRYLELRDPDLYEVFRLRSKVAIAARNILDENGFLEVETPILTKSTPEGARDYLVPSRVHNGEFYALPQSPQLFKQLLMVGGFDRYFQIAKCFRDEDLRWDRQPEFTQIDVEMSFITQEDIINLHEELFVKIVEKFAPEKTLKFNPFKRMTYKEAMEKYGSDKPDLRFDLEISDVTDIVKNCGFKVFANIANSDEGTVRALKVPKWDTVLTRKDINELTKVAQDMWAKWLAYVQIKEEWPSGPVAKFLSSEEFTFIVEAKSIIYFPSSSL